MLTRRQDYLYNVPRLTQEKRARFREMARRRTGRKVKSAVNRKAQSQVLYGSGLQGRKVTAEVARRASEEAEAIYNAIIENRQQKGGAEQVKRQEQVVHEGSFDPTSPRLVDWQRVIEHVAKSVGLTPRTRPKVESAR